MGERPTGAETPQLTARQRVEAAFSAFDSSDHHLRGVSRHLQRHIGRVIGIFPEDDPFTQRIATQLEAVLSSDETLSAKLDQVDPYDRSITRTLVPYADIHVLGIEVGESLVRKAITDLMQDPQHRGQYGMHEEHSERMAVLGTSTPVGREVREYFKVGAHRKLVYSNPPETFPPRRTRFFIAPTIRALR